MTTEEPKEVNQNPMMTLQYAAIMMIVELLMELKYSQPELALRLAKRFKALEDDALAKANPDTMELIRMVTKEIERE